MARKALADCVFSTDTDTKGRFVGYCEEFPDVRTRPCKDRLDAIDEAMDIVRERLRHIDQAIDPVPGGATHG